MAVSTLLNLIVAAKDQASSVLAKIKSAVKGVGDETDETGKKSRGTENNFRGMSDTIAFGIAKANVAMGLAQQGVNFVRNGIAEATQLQLKNISAVTTFASLTGQTNEQATAFIDDLNSSLSKAAATLPGATKDYKALGIAIQDNLIDGFKGKDGTVKDVEGLKGALIGLSESYGALTAASTKDIGNTSLGLSKALSGASTSELRQIAFFEQNPAVLNFIEKELSKLGAKDLGDLTYKSRIKLLEDAGKKLITDEFKKQGEKSVDGLMQAFQTTLFDPTEGIFGLMRPIGKTADGKARSAFSSFNEALDQLIGGEGLFYQIAGVLEAAGVKLPDPMKMLADGFQFVADGLKKINGMIGSAKEAIKDGGNAADILKNTLTDVIQGIFGAAKGIDTAYLGEQAAGMVNLLFAGIFNFAKSSTNNFDVGFIGGVISDGLQGLFTGIGSFLANLDAGVYAALAAGLVASLLVPALTGALTTFGATMLSLFIAGTVGLPLTLTVAAGLAVGALAKAIIDNWSSISTMVGEWFGDAFGIFKGTLKTVVGILTLNGNLITSGVKDLVDGIMGIINKGKDTLALLTGGQTTGEQQAQSVEERSIDMLAAAKRRKAARDESGMTQTTAVDNVPVAAEPKVEVQANFMGNLPEPKFMEVPTAAVGKLPDVIPTAADGLISAYRKEAENAPPGAQPVIANSSEFILKPEQMSRMMTGAAQVGEQSSRGRSVSLGGATFNLYGYQDPETMARECLRFIEIMFDEYQQQQLTIG